MLESVGTVELYLISGIIIAQIVIFLSSLYDIGRLRKLFPKVFDLQITLAEIQKKRIGHIEREEVKSLVNTYRTHDIESGENEFDGEQIETEEIRLLKATRKDSKAFNNILESTNHYLVRNHFHGADFSIIQNIATREREVKDETAYSMVHLPLYLGLLGTIIGVIFGLGSFSAAGHSSQASSGVTDGAINAVSVLEEAIPTLLAGVSWAMVASFGGLLLAVLATLIYRQAERVSSNRLNEYLSFVERELYPGLNTDFSAGVKSLHGNLSTFNQDFQKSLNRLQDGVEVVLDNTNLQVDFLQDLKELDIKMLANANVRTFRELNKSAHIFEKLIAYQSKLSEASSNAQNAAEMFQGIVNRFSNFEENTTNVADHLKKTFDENNEISRYLKANLTEIEKREDFVNEGMEHLKESLVSRVNNMNEAYQVEFNDLKNSLDLSVSLVDNAVQKNIEAIQKHFSRQVDSLKGMSDEQQNQMIHAYEENQKQIQRLFKEGQQQLIEAYQKGQPHFEQLQKLTGIETGLLSLGKTMEMQMEDSKAFQHILKKSIEQVETKNEENIWQREVLSALQDMKKGINEIQVIKQPSYFSRLTNRVQKLFGKRHKKK